MLNIGDGRRRSLEQENERLRRAVAELSTLNELAAEIAQAPDLEEVMQTIIRRSLKAVEAEQGVITLVEQTAEQGMKTLVRTMMSSHTQAALRPDDVLLGWMHQHKAPLLVNDAPQDPRFQALAHKADVRSLLSVPLLVHGRLTGILTIFNRKGSLGFTRDDQRLLSIIAAETAQVVENARLQEERSRVLRIFGQYTSPEIVDELLRAGAEISSQRRYACIMFLDVRGFTAFAERAAPEEVVDYLNTLFDHLIELVNRHHGSVHQLMGDGFMAVFGAPISYGNDCHNAVEAALAILRAVEADCAAGTLPPTRLGIGLHAGEVVAGTIGSAIHKEYKVTGDVVNLAARIEGMNKRFDTRLLISEAVRARLPEGCCELTSLGPVSVRGRTEEVELFRLA